MEETLLSTREAAAYVGISYMALRKAVAAGEITPTVAGSQGNNAHQFSVSDLDRLDRKRVIRPNAFLNYIKTYHNNKRVKAVEQVTTYTYRLTYANGDTEDVSHMATLVRDI